MIPPKLHPLRPPDSSSAACAPAEARALAERVVANVGKVLVGKEEAVLRCLVGLAAKGHLLLEDVPGVGKSSLAQAVARSFDLPASRIQFTSDLLPSDILGVSTWDPSSGAFTFRRGPIFQHVILADELNRTPPRTQSALLEAMAEGQVSLDGATMALPDPFLVIATLNPQEQQGTYPLPESQLDRFLLRLSLGYPSEAEERRLLVQRRLEDPVESLEAVATPQDVLRLRGAVQRVRLEEPIAGYLLSLITATRRDRRLALGASTRAALALAQASRAHALLQGRPFVLPDDVKALAVPVLAHRLVAHEGAAGRAREEIVEDLLRTLPVPE